MSRGGVQTLRVVEVFGVDGAVRVIGVSDDPKTTRTVVARTLGGVWKGADGNYGHGRK